MKGIPSPTTGSLTRPANPSGTAPLSVTIALDAGTYATAAELETAMQSKIDGVLGNIDGYTGSVQVHITDLGNGTDADGVRIVDCAGTVLDTVLYGYPLADAIEVGGALGGGHGRPDREGLLRGLRAAQGQHTPADLEDRHRWNAQALGIPVARTKLTAFVISGFVAGVAGALYTHRFGLYALDTTTQARAPRTSARLYAEICRARALSSETVARYAPELLATMFPG